MAREISAAKQRENNVPSEIAGVKPDIRFAKALVNVVQDRAWIKNNPDFPVYYMYRGIKEKDGLRYDITIMPANMLGEELAKTQGHHHLGEFGEVYTILAGSAIFLMQKTENGKLIDVYAIKAKAGDTAVIPSGYAHITINPSAKTALKMANWISNDCRSDYGLIERNQGACYYFTKTGWIKNSKYGIVLSLRFEKPLKTVPRNLSFLK